MDEQYQAYLLAQIREYFYKKFDSFMIEKWSGSPLCLLYTSDAADD